nr:MAG TPA: hypothetical protein [Caudoviricetes sp.]
MNKDEFYKLCLCETRKTVREVLKRQDVLTLQMLKRSFNTWWLYSDICDAINRKLSGM